VARSARKVVKMSSTGPSRQGRPGVVRFGMIHEMVLVCPTILPFSGGSERERSDRRARPSATAGWTATATPHAFSSESSLRGLESR
jgi:hypothetical protein